MTTGREVAADHSASRALREISGWRRNTWNNSADGKL